MFVCFLFFLELKHGTVQRFPPTQRPGEETVELGSVRLKAWDLGGHEAVRDVWQDYFVQANAVIFMIDQSDDGRLEEAKDELTTLLNDPSLKEAAFLVLANKNDRLPVVDFGELRTFLEWPQIAGKVRSANIMSVSLYSGHGFREAMQWLQDNILD